MLITDEQRVVAAIITSRFKLWYLAVYSLTGHYYSYPFVVTLTCDMQCLKKILPRQQGTPKCGCIFCDGHTNVSHAPLVTDAALLAARGTLFTDADVLTKSAEWEALWRTYGTGMSAAEFELTEISKKWSAANRSFAGMYSLPDVKLESYVIDYLHLTLTLIPLLFKPILYLVSRCILRACGSLIYLFRLRI